MLDSSLIALHSPPRTLKRSASVASLPTPPRTHHKRKRGRSTHSRDTDGSATDEGDESETDDKLIKEAEAEESFWLATNPNPAPQSASPPLLYKRLQQTQAQNQSQIQTQIQGHGVPPVSPPPSHRKPSVKAILTRTPTPKSTCSSAVSPPSTPPNNRSNAIPRDSPNNPFLASPLGSQDEVVIEADPVPSLSEEKPTMAFVFRGVRRSFPNPYYNAHGSTALNPNSQLAPEHPDFEPDERGVRKLLFGVKRKNTASQKSGRRIAEVARGRKGRRVAASDPDLQAGKSTGVVD